MPAASSRFRGSGRLVFGQDAGMAPWLDHLQVGGPSLLGGEAVTARWFANHSRGSNAVGGVLWLTSLRLVFIPNRVERFLRRAEWTSRLDEIIEVRVANAGLNRTNGALRRRLAVRRRDGVDYFVVNKVEAVVASVRLAAGST